MAIWNSSSTAKSSFNDNEDMRDSKDLLKAKTRISKQHLAEHKMFKSKRKNILIGKKFRKKGKDTGKKGEISPKMQKTSAISPSIEEFDKMMSTITKGSKGFKDPRKSMLRKKG